MGRPVYLDYNATTPVDPRVRDAALPYLTRDFGNPSSSHVFGLEPHQAIEQARTEVADLVGGPRDGERCGEVVFTGSGSEANLLALRGSVLAPSAPRSHIITQTTEHPASAATVGGRTIVSVMAANNETGALQPIGELAAIAHAYGAVIHCDAAQAAGKILLDVDGLDVDLLTVVGHKMYAPKGIAALYVRAGLDLEPVVYGGGQEGGRRAGTESVALIAALGTAARLAADDLAHGAGERLAALRDRLQQGLERRLPGGIRLNGPVVERLPNTLNVSITGVVAHELLAAVATLAASTGSACHSGQHTPSPVLTAMGADRDRALGAVRLSLGRWTTTEDVDFAVDEIARAAR